MWEAIKWVSSGLTLAAFLAACFLYYRMKSLEADRDIVKGADDKKKLAIIQVLRDRTPLPYQKLNSKDTVRVALEELQRSKERDLRGFVLALVGLMLMAGVIIVSIWRGREEKVPAKPPEARLAVEYARLFGALETPIIVQIMSHGGRPVCIDDGDMCLFEDPMAEPSATPVAYEVMPGHFSGNLGKFWDSWPYRTALPIATPLWKDVARSGMYGIHLLNHVQPKLGDCILAVRTPWEEDPRLARPKRECHIADSNRVGFLFLVLKNITNQEIRDVSLKYFPLPANAEVDSYLKTLETDGAIGASQQTLAGLKPGESAILLLSIYDKDDKGFETRFLADGIVPREVTFVSEGRKMDMAIRSPRREKAFVAVLPNGWYLQ